jgi:hypothetical protein
MLISILVLQLLHVMLEGLTDFCWFARLLFLVHCVARFGSSVAADVLDATSCASPCGCRPGWPSTSTKSALGACSGGEFTATVAAVASSLTPWFR